MINFGSVWSKVSAQFAKPSGILGHVAGLIMANRESNIQRNKWAVDQLNLKPSDSVLEIGFGPGLAIQMICKIVDSGHVYGIDHSDKMLVMAQKRNSLDMKTGKLTLICGTISDKHPISNTIDKILDINSFQFWQSPVEDLRKLKDYLKIGGTVSLVHQPRKPGSTDDDAKSAADHFADLMREAGYQNVQIQTKKMKPVAAICVTGTY